MHEKGFFILTVPNVNSPVSLIIEVLLDFPPINSARYKSTHVRDFTLRTVKKALANNGFKICKIGGTSVFPSRNSFSKFVANLVPRLSETIVLLAEKGQKPAKTLEVTFDVREL
jgi:hypothetical protein